MCDCSLIIWAPVRTFKCRGKYLQYYRNFYESLLLRVVNEISHGPLDRPYSRPISPGLKSSTQKLYHTQYNIKEKSTITVIVTVKED